MDDKGRGGKVKRKGKLGEKRKRKDGNNGRKIKMGNERTEST